MPTRYVIQCRITTGGGEIRETLRKKDGVIQMFATLDEARAVAEDAMRKYTAAKRRQKFVDLSTLEMTAMMLNGR
jgi:hypothetical protein